MVNACSRDDRIRTGPLIGKSKIKLMNSVYKQIEPKSTLLKPLIKLYYIHQSSDKDAIEKITYFPNYVTTINVYKNSKVHWSPCSRTHEKEKNDYDFY